MMKAKRRKTPHRDPLNWQGGYRFSEENPDELGSLLEDTLGHLRADLVEARTDPDLSHAQRPELIGDIATRLQTRGRHSHV